MRILAVRHGEAEWNVAGREMGHLDSALTHLGQLQASALSRRLGRLRVDIVYTSDLGRAQRTGERISEACGVPLVVDEGLRERNMGIFQGLTVQEMRDQFPEERSAYESDRLDYVIPGGESGRQRLERSVRVMTAIAESHPDQNVVAVTHGGFLMGFFEHVLGMPSGEGWRFRRYNASFNAFEYLDGRWSLETWNDVQHLAGLGSRDDPMLPSIPAGAGGDGSVAG
jgi:broad specificity phosphatase PhoE